MTWLDTVWKWLGPKPEPPPPPLPYRPEPMPTAPPPPIPDIPPPPAPNVPVSPVNKAAPLAGRILFVLSAGAGRPMSLQDIASKVHDDVDDVHDALLNLEAAEKVRPSWKDSPAGPYRVYSIVGKALVLVLLLAVPTRANAPANADPLAPVRHAVALRLAQLAPPAEAAPPAPIVVPAPQVTVLPAATTVSIPADIRDGLVSLASILIPAGIGLGLTWMRGHMTIMQNVAVNSMLTKSAEGSGALLLKTIQKRGLTMDAIDVHSPEVASFAAALIASYPDGTAQVGMTQDKAATVILKQAALLTTPAVTTSVVIPSQPTGSPPHEAPGWPGLPPGVPHEGPSA